MRTHPPRRRRGRGRARKPGVDCARRRGGGAGDAATTAKFDLDLGALPPAQTPPVGSVPFVPDPGPMDVGVATDAPVPGVDAGDGAAAAGDGCGCRAGGAALSGAVGGAATTGVRDGARGMQGVRRPTRSSVLRRPAPREVERDGLNPQGRRQHAHGCAGRRPP